MQILSLSRSFVIAGAALSLTAFSGCASKKYVRTTVEPVQQRVDEVEKQATEKITAVEERVDRDVSRLDEKAQTALNDAAAADQKAQSAQQSADQASGRASEARDFAATGLNQLERRMQDMRNYQLAAQEAVLFDFNSAELSDEAKQKLDAVAQAAQQRQEYIIEVRGFTDTSGNPQYNIQLSQRRAEAVVRHLNGQYEIPLRRIHRVGLGEDMPMGENETREGRQQNRRVEVSVFSPTTEAGAVVSRR